MAPSSSLFRGLKFYLTRTLARDAADEVQELIERHGGVATASPVGATQLVDYEKLDSTHPEWVSVDFIKDSAASGTLQDLEKYSGLVFNSKPIQLHTKLRARYSVEDDARLLHFAKLRGWKSMNSMPPSTWKDAEAGKVTNHTWQSMYEHFKKQLQSKTPKEQRAIMSKAAKVIRTRLQSQEAAEEKQDQATSTAEGASPTTPAAGAREAPPTPATSSPPLSQIGKKARQKRKRVVESSPDNEEKINESIDDDDDPPGVLGINFTSAWTEVAMDPRKRKYLLPLFHGSKGESSRGNAPDTDEPVETPNDNEPPTEVPHEDNTDSIGEEQPEKEVNVRFATEKETEKCVCQLQLETNQDTMYVVHALYYCSGDIDMARTFLKGASPASMWSPDDDLLLVNLVADENVDRSAVAAAVTRGDFDSMQTPRDTDEILARVQFLR